jgi:hypothetical protein
MDENWLEVMQIFNCIDHLKPLFLYQFDALNETIDAQAFSFGLVVNSGLLVQTTVQNLLSRTTDWNLGINFLLHSFLNTYR